MGGTLGDRLLGCRTLLPRLPSSASHETEDPCLLRGRRAVWLVDKPPSDFQRTTRLRGGGFEQRDQPCSLTTRLSRDTETPVGTACQDTNSGHEQKSDP